MIDFFNFYQQDHICRNNPWLILGKGPSFSKLNEFDVSNYNVITLNHVVREVTCLVAHMIDIEVIDHCSEFLLNNASYLLLPWVPHVRRQVKFGNGKVIFEPGTKTLNEYVQEIEHLNVLENQGRLIWYNLATAPVALVRQGSMVVDALDFSSTAVLNLLAKAGAKKIRSLGVDGGAQYANTFDDLKEKTLLQTGQLTYSTQFKEIAKTIHSFNLDYSPLNLESPAVVFVGTEKEQMLAFKVLEYSIKKHSSISVQVLPLYSAIEQAKIDIPLICNPDLQPRTPFSFQRFAIPALKQFMGRAIYFDSDMLVFKDISELWSRPFDGAQIMAVSETANKARRPQFSVMVMDCQALNWELSVLVEQLESGKWTYHQFMYEMAAADRINAELPEYWNELERYREGITGLTHYTDMEKQPWLKSTNINAKIWCEYLIEAIDSGFIDKNYVFEHIDLGWIRPSLRYQIENRVFDPLLIPISVLKNDLYSFTPPHMLGSISKKYLNREDVPDLIKRVFRTLYATARYFFESSGTKELIKRSINRFYLLVK